MAFARRRDQIVGLAHEFVEMHAAFLRERHRGEEQVHQHGFAAPDAGRKCRARAEPRPLRRVKKEKISVLAGGE